MREYIILRFHGLGIIESVLIDRAADLRGHLAMPTPNGIDIVTSVDGHQRYIDAYSTYPGIEYAGVVETFTVSPEWEPGYNFALAAGYDDGSAAMEVYDAQRAGDHPQHFTREMEILAEDWNATD